MAEESKKTKGKKAAKPATRTEQEKSSEQKAERIYRSKSDRMIGGVCAGVAQRFNFDVTMVRIVWAVAVIWGGVGLLAYILAWIIVPEDPDPSVEVKKGAASNSGLVWGVILVLFGCLFLVRQLDLFDFRWYRFHHIRNWWPGYFDASLFLPLLLVSVGIIYLISAIKQGKQPSKSPEKTAGGESMEKKLTRSVQDKMVAGVCAGVAKYFNIDPSIVRVLWAILTLAGGGLIGIIAYVVMMIIVPEESAVQSAGPTPKAPSARTTKSKK